jgi:hypothetical protein
VVISFELFVWYENEMQLIISFVVKLMFACKNDHFSIKLMIFSWDAVRYRSTTVIRFMQSFFASCFPLMTSNDKCEFSYFCFSKNVMETERCEKVFTLHSSVKVKVYCNFSGPFLFERFTEWMTSIRKIRMNGFLKLNFSVFSAIVILWTILGKQWAQIG